MAGEVGAAEWEGGTGKGLNSEPKPCIFTPPPPPTSYMKKYESISQGWYKSQGKAEGSHTDSSIHAPSLAAACGIEGESSKSFSISTSNVSNFPASKLFLSIYSTIDIGHEELNKEKYQGRETVVISGNPST